MWLGAAAPAAQNGGTIRNIKRFTADAAAQNGGTIRNIKRFTAAPAAQNGGTIRNIKRFTADAATKIGVNGGSSETVTAATKIVTYISWLRH